MSANQLIDKYRKWICMQTSDNYDISENEQGNIELDTRYYLGRVNFYEQSIVELRIEKIEDSSTEFFLHFQIADLERAKDLFREMTEALIHLKNSRHKKILLCCTSGLTTSYFAEQLRKASDSMNYPFVFKAVSYNKVYDEGPSYDVILLAPQIAFERKNMSAILKNQLVLNIPPQIFAKYDCGEMIEVLKEELQAEQDSRTTKSERTRAYFETSEKILAIGITNRKNEVSMHYRYYREGNIALSGQINKPVLEIEDLMSVIDFALNADHDISSIGIALPGTVMDGVACFGGSMKRSDIERQVRARYHVDVSVYNDANMIATGIYWLEDRYRNLIAYYQPSGDHLPSCGIVINGHLIRGKNNVAGEVSLMSSVLNLNGEDMELMRTPAGSVEYATKVLIPMVLTIGAEAIFFYNELIPDIGILIKNLKYYLDPQYLPDVIHIEDVREYMMTGIFLRVLWSIDDQKRFRAGLHTH